MSLFTRIKEQLMATPEELEMGNKPRPFWPLKKKDKEAESAENLKTALKAVEEEITVAREGDNMTLLLKLQNESKRLKQKLSELEPISPPSEKSPQAEEEIPTPKEPVPETLQNQTSEVKAEPAPTPLMSSSCPDAYELTEENRKLKKELADIRNQEDKAETVEEPPVPTVPSPSKNTLEDLERQRDAAKYLRERALRRKNMEESAVIYDAMVRELDEEIKKMKGGD